MNTITVSGLLVSTDWEQAVSGQAYRVSVSLDSDWDGRDASIRMAYGKESFQDFAVSGAVATVTVPDGVARIDLGVVSGRLATTNRASVKVLPSMLALTATSTETDPDEVTS